MNLKESIELMKTAELMSEGMSDNLLRDFKYSLETKYDIHSDPALEEEFQNIDRIWKKFKKEISEFPPLWQYFFADHLKGKIIQRLIKKDKRFEPLKKKSKEIFFDTSIKNTIAEFNHYMTVKDKRIAKFNPNQ